jgi:glycosyltransferase involved in cell wall biosynthesis
MASGLPVVATAVGGNAELAEAGVTGTLVPPDDAPSMAAALRSYAESAALCRRHGEEGRRAVDRKFGMDAMVGAYMSVYDGMLGDRKRTSALDWKPN